MRSSLLISLSMLLFAGSAVQAQLAPADDFFHSGAQLYISNNIPAAKEVVEMGRKLYPEDEQLNKLEELLKQQQNQQQQQQDQQQQDQNNKSEDQKPQDPKDQQSKKDQQPKDKPDQQKPDEKGDGDQKNPDEEKKPEEQKKDSGDKPKEEKPEQSPAQPVKPGEMTPEEAKKLLDAQKGREQLLQMQPDKKPRNSSRPVKDW